MSANENGRHVFYIGPAFSTYAEPNLIEIDSGMGEAIVLALSDNPELSADFFRSLRRQCDIALRDIEEGLAR